MAGRCELKTSQSGRFLKFFIFIFIIFFYYCVRYRGTEIFLTLITKGEQTCFEIADDKTMNRSTAFSRYFFKF